MIITLYTNPSHFFIMSQIILKVLNCSMIAAELVGVKAFTMYR
jgi:hypothetical protein